MRCPRFKWSLQNLSIEFGAKVVFYCLKACSGDWLQRGPQIYPVCNGKIGLPPFLAAKV